MFYASHGGKMRNHAPIFTAIFAVSLVMLSACSAKKTPQEWRVYYKAHQSEISSDAKLCTEAKIKDQTRCEVVVSLNFFKPYTPSTNNKGFTGKL